MPRVLLLRGLVFVRATSRITGLLLSIIVLTVAVWPAQAFGAGVAYHKLTIHSVTVHAAFVDLRDPSIEVTPAVAQDEPGGRKSFANFLTQYQPLAQITGSFFDLRSGDPIGDIVIDGAQRYSTAGIGTALAVTPDNHARMLDIAPGEARDWRGYESVLQGGLRLLREGIVAIDPPGQGFHDGYMLRCTHRIAVGLRADERMVLVGIYDNVWLDELAEIMRQLGCRDAMALDGGGSTGFAVDGKRILSTGRKLANVLMVVRRPYDAAAELNALIAHWRGNYDFQHEDLLTINPVLFNEESDAFPENPSIVPVI